MFRTEMRAHAEVIFSDLLAAWLVTHHSAPSAEEAGTLALQSIEFSRIFCDAAAPKD
jgi:hypothetical protein